MAVSVETFFNASREDLDITVVSGHTGMRRGIRENAINRPGLALAGHLKYFANKRIQVLGLAENAYMYSLTKKERIQRTKAIYEKRIPCMVFTRNRKPAPEIMTLADQFRVPVLKSSLITSDFINRATILMESLTAPTLRIHGTMLDIAGIGVLIIGDPGLGKSEAALGLIERGHSLVADDSTVLTKRDDGTIVATPPSQIQHHMEIRGLGIINVSHLFGMASVRRKKLLDLVIKLYKPAQMDLSERAGLEGKTKKLLDVDIPLIDLPVTAGRDMAGVIEVAAMNQRLKNLGVDSIAELNERIKQRNIEKARLLKKKNERD